MTERNFTLPELILWTGTRVALGTGIGMLISRNLSKDAMKAAGLALTVVGGLTTIPLDERSGPPRCRDLISLRNLAHPPEQFCHAE